jgi:hypothetical protein
MAETQCDSSDSENSDVLEGTPVKEDYNKTLIIRPLVSKRLQLQYDALSNPEESPLNEKDVEAHSLSHSSRRYIENNTKSSVTEKETQSKKKNEKLCMLRSTSSSQTNVSSDKTKKYGKTCANPSQAHSSFAKKSEKYRNNERGHRRDAVEFTHTEIPQNRKATVMDTSEESFHSLKLASNVHKCKQRRNIKYSSDSEESVTDKAEGLDVSDTPELLKPLSTVDSYRETEYLIYLSDSETENMPEKTATTTDVSLGKYREKAYIIESSDSEDGSIMKLNEDMGRSSISDESSLETTPVKNATVDSVSREEVEPVSEDGSPVLVTSSSVKLPLQDKECGHTSNDGIQHQTSGTSDTVQKCRTVKKNRIVCLESDTSCSDSTVLKEVSSSSLHELPFKFFI